MKHNELLEPRVKRNLHHPWFVITPSVILGYEGDVAYPESMKGGCSNELRLRTQVVELNTARLKYATILDECSCMTPRIPIVNRILLH